jgi:hypothetical protein
MTRLSNFLRILVGVSGVTVVLLYAAFGLTDLLLSLAAFARGIPEANPFLAWLVPTGMFVIMKLLMTALVACLIVYFYPRRSIQPAAWFALFITAGVDLYHLWGLSVV